MTPSTLSAWSIVGENKFLTDSPTWIETWTKWPFQVHLFMELWILNNMASYRMQICKMNPSFFFFLQLIFQIAKSKTKMFSKVIICIKFEASLLYVQGWQIYYFFLSNSYKHMTFMTWSIQRWPSLPLSATWVSPISCIPSCCVRCWSNSANSRAHCSKRCPFPLMGNCVSCSSCCHPLKASLQYSLIFKWAPETAESTSSLPHAQNPLFIIPRHLEDPKWRVGPSVEIREDYFFGMTVRADVYPRPEQC